MHPPPTAPIQVLNSLRAARRWEPRPAVDGEPSEGGSERKRVQMAGRAAGCCTRIAWVMLIPTSREVAALRQLGMLRSDQLPMIAAYWLVDHDSSSLRCPARPDKADGWMIDQVWTEICNEQGLITPVLNRPGRRQLSFQIAAWRHGDRSLVEVIADVTRSRSRTAVRHGRPRPHTSTGSTTSSTEDGDEHTRTCSRTPVNAHQVGTSHRPPGHITHEHT